MCRASGGAATATASSPSVPRLLRSGATPQPERGHEPTGAFPPCTREKRSVDHGGTQAVTRRGVTRAAMPRLPPADDAPGSHAHRSISCLRAWWITSTGVTLPSRCLAWCPASSASRWSRATSGLRRGSGGGLTLKQALGRKKEACCSPLADRADG